MKRSLFRRLALFMVFSLLLSLYPAFSPAEEADEDGIVEDVILDDASGEALPDEPEPSEEEKEPTARDAFIDDIIALGKELYEKADGKAQRAQYKGDIYVCKNFTVYLFRQTRAKYRMAEYPDTELKIPNNLPAKKCKPYAYGFLWEDVPAEKGNPFYEAA